METSAFSRIYFWLHVFVHVCVHSHVLMYHSTCVEVKGQLVPISSLLLTCRYQGLNSDYLGLGARCLFPLSHLVSPATEVFQTPFWGLLYYQSVNTETSKIALS